MVAVTKTLEEVLIVGVIEVGHHPYLGIGSLQGTTASKQAGRLIHFTVAYCWLDWEDCKRRIVRGKDKTRKRKIEIPKALDSELEAEGSEEKSIKIFSA